MSPTTQSHHAASLIEGWQAVQYDGVDSGTEAPSVSAGWFDVQVPGAIQYDLIRLGKVSNPYASSQAVKDAEWVHKQDWLFLTSFDFDGGDNAGSDVFVDFEGIDTFADVWLNGVCIGHTANAYRSYRMPVDPALLHATGNSLAVHVKGHFRMVEHLVAEAKRRLGPTFKMKGLLRRYQRSFFAGSSLLNLGGEVLGIGIYKPVTLVVAPKRRFVDVHFEVTEASAAFGRALVHIAMTGAAAKAERVEVSLWDEDSGARVATTALPAESDRLDINIALANPKLWWPRGYGKPSRYVLKVDLLDGETQLDGWERKVGFRTSAILRQNPAGRESFQMVINGKPIHARGHNLAPVDYIKVHGEWAVYERLLTLALESNSNMLRIWGGGGIESEQFFEACDAQGIMIWQDFYLHSNTYPDYEPAWVEEFRTECDELLVCLRNRPSLVLVCGGNEQYEGWGEWGWRGQIDRFYGEDLVVDVLSKVSAERCPELPYIVNSPHGGISAQSPVSGDAHVWGNFYNATKDPLFVSETCWSQQSYSRPDTIAKIMDLDLDQFSGIGWPDKWKQLTGLDLITRLPYSGGPLAMDSLASYLRGLDIEQALADHHALFQLRLHSPSCTGILYWPLNKGGPLFQFGCVDYLGYPLASFYVVKRVFADVAIGLYRDVDDIRVIGSNLGGADETLRRISSPAV